MLWLRLRCAFSGTLTARQIPPDLANHYHQIRLHQGGHGRTFSQVLLRRICFGWLDVTTVNASSARQDREVMVPATHGLH